MDEVSLNSEPAYDDEADDFEIEGECGMADYIGQSGVIQGQNPLPPAVGMEFESYDDVYCFYNCYAKDQGFGVRVSNTWYRKSKERYRGKLSCSSAGFKKKSEANRPRPETRTGCPAMVKVRLIDNKRWRIIEVELEHNHLISPASGKFYKSHKTTGVGKLGTKRPPPLDTSTEEVKKVRLFRTVLMDAEDNGNVYSDDGEFGINVDQSNQLKLKQGDAQAIFSSFCHFQLTSSNFFYVMDFNEKGYLRNVFWADSRCRVAYGYFGDVVAIDTTCLTEKYEVPLVVFTGANHHGHPVLLGCGLISGENVESFTWLFRAWLTYVLGRPPSAIITTDLCKSMQAALSDVFPRASVCHCLSRILEKVPEKLGGLHQYESIKMALTEAVYQSLRADEFEAAWEDMMQRYGLRDNEWLQLLYEDRKRWVPVYLKEIFLAGMLPVRPGEGMASFFKGCLHKCTPLKDFLCEYDQVSQKSHQEEALSDLGSRSSSPALKSRCYFELQLSKLYTNNIFKKFQGEVEGMYLCFSRQISVDGSINTYIVKEHAEVAENRTETRDYEVMYNTSEGEVLCICGLFNFQGYLCRHALSILDQNGMQEIPPQYILSRWRKDIQRNYVIDHGCNVIDINNPVHMYDHLYKRGVQVVEQGRKSQDCYKFALQALDEILNKVHLAEDIG